MQLNYVLLLCCVIAAVIWPYNRRGSGGSQLMGSVRRTSGKRLWIFSGGWETLVQSRTLRWISVRHLRNLDSVVGGDEIECLVRWLNSSLAHVIPVVLDVCSASSSPVAAGAVRVEREFVTKIAVGSKVDANT